MRETKAERSARFYRRMEQLGFTYDEASTLRRIEMTLQRWGVKRRGFAATELHRNSCADHLKAPLAKWAKKHGKEHPAYLVAVGQFQS